MEEGMKVCINGQGHMTKMAAMAINRKKPLKIFFFRTRRPMNLKLGMKHLGMELYKVCVNGYPGMTLTYRTARSTEVAHAFEWGKIGKCHLMAENLLGMSKWTEE